MVLALDILKRQGGKENLERKILKRKLFVRPNGFRCSIGRAYDSGPMREEKPAQLPRRSGRTWLGSAQCEGSDLK